MVESAWWHPVAAERDLRDQPLGVRVLGRELVLWRDSAERVHAFDDRCPHRGAKLSLGRVHGQELQCGYHGWRFDTAGCCTAIPALPRFEPPASSAVGRHSAASAHGMLWVGLDGLQGAPRRLANLPAREVVCGPFDAATAAPRVVENFLDMAHFGFVHEGFLGDRRHTEVPDYEVTLTPDGRPLAPHYRAWQPQASATAGEGAWVEYRYEVLSPFAALLHKRAKDLADAPDEAYALWCCPTDAESTRVWFTLFTSDATTPHEALRAFQQTIFDQDRPIIESQRPRRLPLAGGEAASAADRLSAAYRRYLKVTGISYGVC
jgi:phenylpropionate dioxygenase-like ring-hydroxylating dioxygenase large terminal subunit